jgi:hypothetical protein
MKGMRSFSLRAKAMIPVVAALVVASFSGCWLIDPSISKLTFDLPTETYSFDTSMWSNLPKGTVPAVPCPTIDCCTAGTAAGIDCSTTMLTCNVSGVCEADVPESASSSVNLAMQVPVLQTFAGHALSNITISSISYVVSNNTLNVPLPEMTIYLAPDGVTDPTSPLCQKFGTIPSIPAMTDTSGMVQLVSNASQVFATFTGNISNPFNIIAAGTVTVVGGSPVPMGAITLAVTGTVSAQI